MKYFYSLIAVSIAFSASAVDFGTLQTRNDRTPVKEIQAKKVASSNQEAISVSHDLPLNMANKTLHTGISSTSRFEGNNVGIMHAKKVSPHNSSIEGSWQFVMGDYYFQDSAQGEIIVNYDATLDGDYVIFQDPSNMYLPFVAMLNDSGNSITITREILGSTQGLYIFQAPFIYNYATQGLDYQDISGKYSAANGTISFAADHGIAWSAYNDQEGTNFEGYYDILDIISGKLQNGGGGGTTSDSIEGEWEFSLGDYYFEDSTGEFTAYFEATIEDEYVYFQDPSGYELPFVAKFNQTSNVLTFIPVYLGTAGEYYICQEPFVVNVMEGKLDYVDEIRAQYVPDAGVINFVFDNGLAWTVYADSQFSQFMGYASIYDLVSAKKTTVPDNDDDQWKTIGDALFMDGWVLPGFEIDQLEEDNQYYVPLQQNIENPNLYRLVDPYHSGPVARYNTSNTIGHIVFDVTDPQHVVFEKADAGFALSQLGITKFYCYNTLGAVMATEGLTREQAIDFYGDYIPYTTFENGVVDLSYIDTNNGISFDANFGYQGAPNGLYAWGDDTNMSASITFPNTGEDAGIREIGNNSLDTRYFNLLGVEVKNPQEGGIYIKVAGSKSEKIVVK